MVLVHGSIVDARRTWRHQFELAKRWTLVVMDEGPSWEADVPLDALARAPFRTLVLSGGHSPAFEAVHSPAFEAVCDAIAERLHAERDTIAGRGHTIPSTGAQYNARLEAFLRA